LRREHLPDLAAGCCSLEERITTPCAPLRHARGLRLQPSCHAGHERAGFCVIGRRRDAALALGARRDSILMEATIADFDSPVLARLHPAE
jgi:hypothetical protein